MKTTLIALTLALASLSFSGCGEDKSTSTTSSPSVSKSPAAINFQSELKGVISEFTGSTLTKLSDVGTFLNDPAINIPLPKEISDLSSSLKAAGKSDLIENLSSSIQESAANAIKEVQKPLAKILDKIPADNSLSLITGSDDAITRHIESASREQFAATVKPALVDALNKSGASDIVDTLKSTGAQASGALSALKGMGIKTPTLDLNLEQYVNDHVVDLIFTKMAAEEKKIRANPTGRFAELFQAAKDKVAEN